LGSAIDLNIPTVPNAAIVYLFVVTVFKVTPTDLIAIDICWVSVSSRGNRFGLPCLSWVHKLADRIGINAKENTPEVRDREKISDNLQALEVVHISVSK
jgi:hypothetical protein